MRGAAANSLRNTPIVLMLLFALLASACGHKAPVVQPPVAQPPRANAPATRPAQPPVTPAPIPKGVTPAKQAPPAPVSATTDVRGPLIRIGLTVQQAELRISASREFILVEKSPEAMRQSLRGQVQVRLEQSPSEAGEIYRVQVASLANQSSAGQLSRQLSEQFSQPSVVRENPSTGMNQVRIGRFATRDDAQAFASGPIFSAGFRDAFVVREVGETNRREPTLTLRGPENLFRVSRIGYLFLPASELDFLCLNGKSYRGVLDISLGKDGRLIVVNQLGMEEYLLGVVPAELSPTTYPEEAALEAQAIAARTYALKNMGKSRAEGYDLKDDTTAQVYGGASLEKDTSSEAVRKTAGVAIYYNGGLIDAMYMSTCGGRTEDFSNVFDAPPVPYLKSVFCAAESSPGEMPASNLMGGHELKQVVFVDDGTPANRELELAQALGLVDLSRIEPEAVAGFARADEIRGWVEKSRTLAGKNAGAATNRATELNSRAGFLDYAARSFFGDREIERGVSESDTAYYLKNFSDGSSVPQYARRTIAYLAYRKLWQPYPDNSIRSAQPVLRGDALALLIRWIIAARPEVLKSGVLSEPDPEKSAGNPGSTLAVKRGNRSEQLRLARDVRLFKSMGGRSMPVLNLQIIGGEKVTYHQGSNSEIDFLEVELSPSGASSDRLSPMATWRVAVPRARAAEKLRALAGNIGEIQDLRPARLGESGRVVQVEIIGSRGSAIVNGYKVRGALGLGDTLYQLSRTRTENGDIAAFVFDGRGWGHGVGLCQTGAVGMARAGRSAEEILLTYYQGVELRKAY